MISRVYCSAENISLRLQQAFCRLAHSNSECMIAGRDKKTGSKEKPKILTQTSAVVTNLRGAARDEFAMSDGEEDHLDPLQKGVRWGHWMW